MAISDPKGWSESLHNSRGSGSGSRVRLDLSKLEEAGWKVIPRESGNKVLLSFIDPEGRKYKSSKDVERELDSRGTLQQFSKEEKEESLAKRAVIASHSASDEDYEPPVKQKACNDVVKTE